MTFTLWGIPYTYVTSPHVPNFRLFHSEMANHFRAHGVYRRDPFQTNAVNDPKMTLKTRQNVPYQWISAIGVTESQISPFHFMTNCFRITWCFNWDKCTLTDPNCLGHYKVSRGTAYICVSCTPNDPEWPWILKSVQSTGVLCDTVYTK